MSAANEKTAQTTIDQAEVDRFSAMAAEWWSPTGKFRPLHKFNPVRLTYIRDRVCAAASSGEYGAKARGFTTDAVIAMRKHPWPGNIRELENRLKKAIVLSDNPLLTPEDLDLQTRRPSVILPLAQAKEEFQRRYINRVLDMNAGNRTKTARDLDVDPRTIFRHLVRDKLDGTEPDDSLLDADLDI